MPLSHAQRVLTLLGSRSPLTLKLVILKEDMAKYILDKNQYKGLYKHDYYLIKINKIKESFGKEQQLNKRGGG